MVGDFMKLKEKLNLLPNKPGCYLMKDSFETVIYVGKAKNLNNRVKSYFTGSHNYKTAKLISEIKDFEIILTNSEQESLILELNLIKEYRPKYNIVFMDDKTYPYIEITKTTPPTIKVVRTKDVKGKLFGPYPNVKSARTTARFLELLFPMGRIEAIPNFYEDIGKEIEPDTSNNYKKQVRIIERFLKGDIRLIKNALEEHMLINSQNQMYERAAVIRDQLSDILDTTEKQIVSLNDYKDRDIIGYAYNKDDVSIQILFMRRGKIIDQHRQVFSYVGNVKYFVINYLNQFYNNHFPDELLFDTSFNIDELTDFKNPFIPKIGDKRKIVKLANKNAKYDLKHYHKLYRSKFEQTVKTISELRKLLELDELDLIETFDNSQLFGTAPISAMVVYENGKFNKKLYRKYHLNSNPNDDYGSLKEVLYRRYQRVLMDNLRRPNLILVDGGIGHVNIANEVIKSLNLNILVAGLKKDNKHKLESLVLSEREINIKENKDVYNLLHKISEEVHRYAISFHRNVRSKNAYSSPLDNVKGLGSVRKNRLLKEYKSLEEIKLASEEELRSLGIPVNVVKSLKDVLNNEGND